MRWPGSSPAPRTPSSTRTRPSPATSPAIPTSPSRPNTLQALGRGRGRRRRLRLRRGHRASPPALLGDSIATNMFMLGYAYQKGLIPIGHEALEQAIELNGAAVPMNTGAFRWGRRAAADRAAVEKLVAPAATTSCRSRIAAHASTRSWPSRVKHLTGYQNAALAERYKALVERVRAAEQKTGTARRPRRSRRAQLRQAAGLQGRVRGRAALRRCRLPGPARPASSRATTG